MDDYAYEIHTPNDIGDWVTKESRTIQGYDEGDAQSKANDYADRNYSRWRVRNIRLIKKFANPDNEI